MSFALLICQLKISQIKDTASLFVSEFVRCWAQFAALPGLVFGFVSSRMTSAEVRLCRGLNFILLCCWLECVQEAGYEILATQPFLCLFSLVYFCLFLPTLSCHWFLSLIPWFLRSTLSSFLVPLMLLSFISTLFSCFLSFPSHPLMLFFTFLYLLFQSLLWFFYTSTWNPFFLPNSVFFFLSILILYVCSFLSFLGSLQPSFSGSPRFPPLLHFSISVQFCPSPPLHNSMLLFFFPPFPSLLPPSLFHSVW